MIAVTNDYAKLQLGFPEDDDHFAATTDDEGRFALRAMAPRKSLLTLYATHDQGTAFVPHDRYRPDARIELEPWMKLDGYAAFDGKPRSDAEIELTCHRVPGNSPYLIDSSRVRTDSDGRFTFDRVPAGFNGSLRRVLDDGSPGFGIDFMTLPDPRNNEIETIFPRQLNLDGCTVTGRIQVPPMKQPFVSALIHHAPQRFEPPGGFEQLSQQEQSSIFNDWFDSPAGHASRQSCCYTVMRADEEGRFRVEDVPPGDLEILIEIHELNYSPLRDLWQRIRRIRSSIQFKRRFKNPGGCEPIDLGLISG